MELCGSISCSYLLLLLVNIVLSVPVDRFRGYSQYEDLGGNFFADYMDTDCQPGEVQCTSALGTIKCLKQCQFCDGIVDCLNAWDERNCACKTRLAGHYVCDGEIHCEDLSDELGCGDCLDNELSCGLLEDRAPSCVPISAFCEGDSCPNYERNLVCRRLSMKKIDHSVTSSFRSKGYLQSYVDGNWIPVCGSAIHIASSIVSGHCTEITGSEGSYSYQLESLSEDYNGLWAVINNSTTVYSDKPLVFESAVKSCRDRMLFYAECAPPPCQQNIADQPQSKIASRIVGGESAHYESWRHHVAIFKDGEYQCGGSILNDRWILSASHCYMKITGSRFEVLAGSAYRTQYFPGSQREFVSHIVRHSEFDSYTITNDIALLRLKTPLQLNRWVKPTCLHQLVDISPGALCSIPGWGLTEENGTLAGVLQEVNIPVLDVDKCIETFTYVDTQKVVCAGHESGGKDSCQGDSGGPLMCYACEEGSNPSQCLQAKWAQAGIVSYGRGCARVGVPGVYTRVQPFLEWIQQKISGTESDVTLLPTTVPFTFCASFSCLGEHGLCLDHVSICDGKVDCFDASDELNCQNEALNATKDDDSGHQRAEVSRNRTLICDDDQYKCSAVPQCIPYKLQCDEIRHCIDGTDELGCHCVDRLYIRHPSWICDGVNDCFDLGDEFCPICDFDEWACLRSRTCISVGKRCDGNFDCKYGEDELHCVALVPGNHSIIQLDKEGHPLVYQEGRLLIYSDNKLWTPICSESLTPDVAEQICSYLGYHEPIGITYETGNSIPFAITKPTSRNKRLIKTNKLYKHLDEYRKAALSFIGRGEELRASGPKNHSQWFIPYHRSLKESVRTKRDVCSMVNIECGERKCGTISHLQFSEDPPLGDLANLPWAVHVSIGGIYRCGGTLIGDHWAVTSLQCMGKISLSSEDVYVVAGSNRDTGSTRLLGSKEVALRVDVVVPVGSADLMLLHLEDSISPYSYLSWLCLDKSKLESLWKECVFAGRFRDKFGYQLLVLQNNTATCSEDKFCSKFHSRSDICLNKWSGLLSCRLAREEDSIWYAAAIWMYDGSQQCSQPTDHMKLTSDIIDKIHSLMEKDYTKAPQLPCNGHSCAVGLCVEESSVCDGTLDCADLTDEWTQCNVPIQMCASTGNEPCVCEPGYFACSDHVCIEDYKVCDGTSDCGLNEDEVDCDCAMKFPTSNEVNTCDGMIDCYDQTDELDCGCDRQFRCYRPQSYNYKHNKSVCIDIDNVCDTVEDCSKGEDEDHCVTLTTTIYAEEDALGRPAANHEGYLIVKYIGEWFTVLLEDWPTLYSDLVCQKLQFKGSLQTIGKPLNISAISKFSRNVPPITADYRVQEESKPNIVTYVICEK